MSHLHCKPSNCQSPIHDDHHRHHHIIIIIIIVMMIFALALICAVSAGGRTRSHLDWLKTSSPKIKNTFCILYFTQIVFRIFSKFYFFPPWFFSWFGLKTRPTQNQDHILYFVFYADWILHIFCHLYFVFLLPVCFNILNLKSILFLSLYNETFCAHKCIFSAQDCNSSADIPKARVAAAGTVFSSS